MNPSPVVANIINSDQHSTSTMARQKSALLQPKQHSSRSQCKVRKSALPQWILVLFAIVSIGGGNIIICGNHNNINHHGDAGTGGACGRGNGMVMFAMALATSAVLPISSRSNYLIKSKMVSERQTAASDKIIGRSLLNANNFRNNRPWLNCRGGGGGRHDAFLHFLASSPNDVDVLVSENEIETMAEMPVDEIMLANTKTASGTTSPAAEDFDAIVNARYACTRFQRFQEPSLSKDESTVSDHATTTTTDEEESTMAKENKISPSAAVSDPSIVQKAHQCLALAQRAPTGFNAQPFRVILVHSKEAKERLAEYCLGRNADRVRDSDCTAVFLSDRECGRDGKRFADFLLSNMDASDTTQTTNAGGNDAAATTTTTTTTTKSMLDDATKPRSTSRTRRPLSERALLKLRVLILLFSSGYPLPQFISIPFSLGVRMAMSIISFFARMLYSMKKKSRLLSSILPDIQLLPTLSSAETWSQKNTMLVAMTYMLACTSRGLATCPMEGVDASGVRKALGIPRGRFGIPLIVSVGTPYRRGNYKETDDVGVSHSSSSLSPRYPLEEVVYGNKYGMTFESA